MTVSLISLAHLPVEDLTAAVRTRAGRKLRLQSTRANAARQLTTAMAVRCRRQLSTGPSASAPGNCRTAEVLAPRRPSKHNLLARRRGRQAGSAVSTREPGKHAFSLLDVRRTRHGWTMKQYLGLTVAILILANAALAPGQRQAQDRSPQKVISTHEIDGRFLGYCEGDYLHVGFQPKDEKAKWFFLWTQSPRYISYFLAMHRGEWMRVRYEVTDTFIWEGGGRYEIEVLTDAKTKTESYREWYDREGPSILGAREDTLEKLVRSQFVDCSGKRGQR